MKPDNTRTHNQNEVHCMKFDRDQILNRYWELANLTPEQTKGNVTGQLRALELLLEALSAKPTATAAKAAPFYRAAWMDLPTPDRKM
jgi:hypothetical protein